MKKINWLKEKRLCFKIGLILGFIHFIFSIYIANYMITWSSNAQWQLAWIFAFAIDLPISLLYILVLSLPFHNIHFSFLPYPVSELRDFLLPMFFISVFGTLWYLYLPILISIIIRFIKKRLVRNEEF